MVDITPAFNVALQARDAPPVTAHRYSVDRLDEFLKEAYSINARIADLTTYLRAIRPSYLSSTQAARQPRRQDGSNLHSAQGGSRHLTDAERTAIDAEAKTVLRQLHSAVSRLAQVEQVRQDTVSNVALRRRAKGGLGALGRWAAGGTATTKSAEEGAEDDTQKGISAHREGVIWYLQRKLEEAGSVQGSMMEIRIQREIEKSKSVLFKSRTSNVPYDKTFEANFLPSGPAEEADKSAARGGSVDEHEQLSKEQLQLFAQENQDMLKHYEDTLDQVRTAEKSLLEISELQTSLAANLTMQSAHIDQLVQDSFLTTENIGRGNKELKRASERASTARLLFHSTCAFCAFLVVWDLVF